MKRFVQAVLLAALLAITLAGPADAHVVYENGYSYSSSTNCTWQKSEISHGSQGTGYWKSEVNSKYFNFTTKGHCGSYWSRPTGYLAARYITAHWLHGQWNYCTGIDWQFNGSSGHHYKAAVNNGYPWPPCGQGIYYSTTALGSVYNGGWYGGQLTSGYHILPA